MEKHVGKCTIISSRVRKTKTLLKIPKSWILATHSLSKTKTNFQPWGKWRKLLKSWKETHRSSVEWERKNRWMKHEMGMHFQAFTCPRSQKHFFPKMGGFPIRIWLTYSFHPHALFHQPISGRNNWLAQKDKMVGGQPYGFTLSHLAFPHWLKGLIISLSIP